MSKIEEEEFHEIIEDIMNHQEFMKLKNEKHHDRTKFDHSYRIAKATYRLSKNTNLDVESAVRGAMLHDFFFKHQIQNRMIAYVKHPKISLETAEKHFNLNYKEKNIIESHMFPASIKIPKYKESLLVSVIDKTVSIEEMFVGYLKEVKELIQKV